MLSACFQFRCPPHLGRALHTISALVVNDCSRLLDELDGTAQLYHSFSNDIVC